MTTDTAKPYGRLPNLKNDVMFKAIFVRNHEVLREFLNSVLEFKGGKEIESIEILNPDLPQTFVGERGANLDLLARSQASEQFHVEMQALSTAFYPERALFYWSKLYSKQLKKGESYKNIKKVYSLHIIDFNHFIETDRYKTVFGLLAIDEDRKIRLTEDLEIVFVELKKLPRHINLLKSELKEAWLYLIKNSDQLTEEEIQDMSKRTPVLNLAVEELEKMKLDEKLQHMADSQLIAELTWNTQLHDAVEKGKAEVACNMLAMGLKTDLIVTATGLSVEQVEELKNDIASPKSK